jgi:hypothetical protein
MSRKIKIKNDVVSDRTNSNNVNRGQPIYFKNELHYIVYEFEDKMLISLHKNLSKAYCVNKIDLTIKPIK